MTDYLGVYRWDGAQWVLGSGTGPAPQAPIQVGALYDAADATYDNAVYAEAP